MEITYLGAGCVRLSGKGLSVICNPYDASYGLGSITAKADVVTTTTVDGYPRLGTTMVFDTPGEYEIKGSMISGVAAKLHTDEGGHNATVFSIIIDGVNVVVTGNISGKLDQTQLEPLGKVDVLIVPVGNHGLTMDAQGASEVITQLEPSYVIPVHFADGKTKYPVDQDGVEHFLQELGASPEPVAKLKVSGELPSETQVVLLSRLGA
jgi:L-ascorbate metabolism protein UlaG (beta-lactamase superfamily)